jgi:hypothetical protein
VLDNLLPAGGLVVHHSVEVLEIEPPPVDEQLARPDEVDGVLGLELPQHPRHCLGERFWLSWHHAHGPVLYIL